MTFVYVLLILLCFLSPALVKADPATAYIPVSVDEDARYSIDVNISGQALRFLLSTSTGYSIVAGKTCETCGTEDSYDPSQSSSMHPLSSNQNLAVLSDTGLRGDFIKDDCSLTMNNGSHWAYLNQTVFVANQSESLFLSNSSYSGVFGLSTNARDDQFTATVYDQWLQNHADRSNFSFGIALTSPRNSSTSGGFLHWMAPDASAFKGAVSWKSTTPARNTTAPTGGDLTVDMDGWSFSSESGLNISRKGGEGDKELKTFVDPFFLPIVFPESETNAIYGGIEDAVIRPRSDGALSIQWSVPCDTKMELILTFGDISVTLDESALVRPAEDGCVSLLEHWASGTVEEYLLGSAVVSQLYMIFLISRDGSSIGFADRADPKSNNMHTHALIGISLGAAALAIVLCGTAFMIYRARKKRRDNPKNIVEPFMLGHSTSTGSPERRRLLTSSPTPPVSPRFVYAAPGPQTSPGPTSAFHQFTPNTVIVQPAPFSPGLDYMSTPSTSGPDNPPPPPYGLSPSPQPQLLPPPRDRKWRNRDRSPS